MASGFMVAWWGAQGGVSGSAQRFAMFAEVRRRLAQAAGPGGLLLVLDDLQWADEASAVLLADVVRQLREVARLVGRGLTNKQIGHTLYVSERTAENHVQHMLAKLGLRNRSQIATWASGEHGASRL